MKKIIGEVTIYHGQEHRYLDGYKVRIVAVLHNAAKPGIDLDGAEYAHLDNDREIEAAGGVSVYDRIEVQPWLEKENRFSFISSDSLSTDLECFANLAKAGKKGKNR